MLFLRVTTLKGLGSLSQWVKENLHTVVQYTDYLTPGDVDSADEIAEGQGAVLRRGLDKVAVYRDEQGKCHEVSAVCPHLGGIVRWNQPCHGSRFTAKGAVICGPATAGLEALKKPRKTG